MAVDPANTRAKFPFVDPRHERSIAASIAGGAGPADYRLDEYFHDGLRDIFNLARMPVN